MMRGYGPGFGPGFHPYGYGLFGGLLTLLMFAGIAILIVMLVRRRHLPYAFPQAFGPMPDPLADARALAARRFAAGEITKEQYEEINTTLLGRPDLGRAKPDGSDAPTVPLG